MTPRRSFFSFFSLSLLLAVCCTLYFLHQFWYFSHLSNFTLLPFSFFINLFANNKRDKKNGTRLILVDFSSVVFPLFWMIRFRLRSHSSARGFCTGRVSRKSGRFRKNFFFRAVDLEEKLPSVSVCLSKCAGLAGVNTKSRAHGAKVQSIQGRDFRIIHEFVRVNCNHRCL